MVAAPDVVVCFLAAVAHNILLIATSTVVVVMVVVFIYWWYSSWILWLDSYEQVYMSVLLCSSIAANAYKSHPFCD